MDGQQRTSLAVSVVIPVHQDTAALQLLLTDLRPLPPDWEVVIVCSDADTDFAATGVDCHPGRCIQAPLGRGLQQRAGACASYGRLLWFLHADTRLPKAAIEAVRGVAGRWDSADDLLWGRFDVRLVPDFGLLSAVAKAMNWRSRWSGICTGDQGIFVSRSLLERTGGFPEQPLMEDIELSKQLKGWQSPLCLRVALDASSRRWRDQGVWKTIFAMWMLRLRYYLGASPDALARAYYS